MSPQPSTTTVSAAAAAPESSTLAVKLSDSPDSNDKDARHEQQEQYHQQQQQSQPYRQQPRYESHTYREADGMEDAHAYANSRRLRSSVRQDDPSTKDQIVSEEQSKPKDRSPDYASDRDNAGDHSQSQNNAREHDKQYLRQQQHQDQGQGQGQGQHSTQEDSQERPTRNNHSRDEQGTDEDRDNMEDDGYGDDEDDNGEESESMDTNSSKNDDGSDPLVVSMYGSPSLVKVRSMFIDKLFKMVEDPAIQHLIAWAKEGDMFYVFNCIELSTSVLPKFFKHNNWQSFVRQLNIYRYDREESNMNRRNPETQRWQFYHPDFQRDQPHLRSNIKRKSARSINMVPTYSRVVFEPEKGYFMQQDGGHGPFGPSGPGGRFRVHSTGTPQNPNRPYPGMSSPGGYNPRPPHAHPKSRLDYRMDDHDPMASTNATPMNILCNISNTIALVNRLTIDLATTSDNIPTQVRPAIMTNKDHQVNIMGQNPLITLQSVRHMLMDMMVAIQARIQCRRVMTAPQTKATVKYPSMKTTVPGKVFTNRHGLLAGAGGHFRSQSAPGLDPRREATRIQETFSNTNVPFDQQGGGRSPSHSNASAYPNREHPSQPGSTPLRPSAALYDESERPINRDGPVPGDSTFGGMSLSKNPQSNPNEPEPLQHRNAPQNHPHSPMQRPPVSEPIRHPSYPDEDHQGPVLDRFLHHLLAVTWIRDSRSRHL
ncbi:hypothetical protein BGZ94_003837 [Podila epigama]|nr:hypothetical protein BGZ94_003837 [Podila epigama]